MKPWLQESIEAYHSFIKEKTIVLENNENGWHCISTPFFGAFNDSINLYCKKDTNTGKIMLSDDGLTLHNLELQGFSIKSSLRRKELYQGIELNHGVKINKTGEITTEANTVNFPQKKLNLLSAIIEINDLQYLSKPLASNFFLNDVKNWLEEESITYTPKFTLQGSTKLNFTFDFQIARRKSEILINSVSAINQQHLANFLFGWEDIKQPRESQSGKKLHCIAIINDNAKQVKKPVKDEFIEAIAIKGAESILFSERHKPENLSKLKEAA